MSKLLLIFLLLLAFPTVVLGQTPTIDPDEIPALTILSPKEDANLFGDKVEIVFVVNNFSIVDPQKQTVDKEEQGHIALYFDQEKNYSDAQIISKLSPLTLEEVTPGKHTLIMELMTNTGKPLDPPVLVSLNFTTVGRPTVVISETIAPTNSSGDENLQGRADTLALFTSISVGAVLFIGGVIFLIYRKK